MPFCNCLIFAPKLTILRRVILFYDQTKFCSIISISQGLHTNSCVFSFCRSIVRIPTFRKRRLIFYFFDAHFHDPKCVDRLPAISFAFTFLAFCVCLQFLFSLDGSTNFLYQRIVFRILPSYHLFIFCQCRMDSLSFPYVFQYYDFACLGIFLDPLHEQSKAHDVASLFFHTWRSTDHRC